MGFHDKNAAFGFLCTESTSTTYSSRIIITSLTEVLVRSHMLWMRTWQYSAIIVILGHRFTEHIRGVSWATLKNFESHLIQPYNLDSKSCGSLRKNVLEGSIPNPEFSWKFIHSFQTELNWKHSPTNVFHVSVARRLHVPAQYTPRNTHEHISFFYFRQMFPHE